MDPEPARKFSQQPSFRVAAPTLAILGFIVAFTSLGIPLAAVLTDRPPLGSLTPLTAQDRHGSEVPPSFSLSGTTQSDR
jgi:hypothetical protein